MQIFSGIVSLFIWAMTIGVAGGLVDMAINMRSKALEGSRSGIVSMKSLTNQLMAPDHTIRDLKASEKDHTRH